MVGFIISMQYIHNIQYTSSYMRSYVLRFVFLALVWPSVKLTDTFHPVGVDMDLAKASWDDIDLSESAILESIVEKTAPNIKFEQFSELVNRELNGILGLIGQRDIHHLARILYYYAHMSWASNVLEKLPLTTQQSRTYLPTTWGPMISSSLFEDLTLNDVFYPRQELLTIVESETGLPFEKLRPLSEEKSTDNPRISTSKYKENVYSSILVEHDHLLSIDQSILLQRMSGDNSRWYERELENVTGLIENGQGSFSSVTKASRVVNLELLLRNSI